MAGCSAPTALAFEKVCRISAEDRSSSNWDVQNCSTFAETSFPPCDSPCVSRTLAADSRKCYSLACYRYAPPTPTRRVNFCTLLGPGCDALPRSFDSPNGGWLDDPGFACYEYSPEALATCYCYENLGMDKVRVFLERFLSSSHRVSERLFGGFSPRLEQRRVRVNPKPEGSGLPGLCVEGKNVYPRVWPWAEPDPSKTGLVV
jgi:hypothetical protein